MAPPHTIDSIELRKHLLDLPQEIYDIIHDLTFTTPHNTVRIVSTSPERLGHPHALAFNLMQVSSATREQYLSSFYRNTVFQFHGLSFCETWMLSIPSNHGRRLQVVRCVKHDFSWANVRLRHLLERAEVRVACALSRWCASLHDDIPGLLLETFYVVPTN